MEFFVQTIFEEASGTIVSQIPPPQIMLLLLSSYLNLNVCCHNHSRQNLT